MIHTIGIGAEIHAQAGMLIDVGWSLIPIELEVVGDAIMVEVTVAAGERVQVYVSVLELDFN